MLGTATGDMRARMENDAYRRHIACLSLRAVSGCRPVASGCDCGLRRWGIVICGLPQRAVS